MFELQQRAKQDPMVNPLGDHPADYTPPELMLSAPPPCANPATAVDQWLHSRGHSHYTAAICDAFSQAGFPQAEWLLELQQMSPVDLDLFLETLAKSPESMEAEQVEAVPSESAVQATSLNSIKDTVRSESTHATGHHLNLS
jgi:hypothetical protein